MHPSCNFAAYGELLALCEAAAAQRQQPLSTAQISAALMNPICCLAWVREHLLWVHELDVAAEEVMIRMESFPVALIPHQQGLATMGYYARRAALRAAREKSPE